MDVHSERETVEGAIICPICEAGDALQYDFPLPSILPLSYKVNEGPNAILYQCFCCHTVFRYVEKLKEEYYTKVEDAENFDSIISVYSPEHGGYVSNHYIMSKFLGKNLNGAAQRILDVGCGNGMFLKELKSQFPDYSLSGYDVSEYLIEQFQDDENIRYLTGGLDTIRQEFDAITLIDSLSFIYDIGELFSFMDDHLADDGVVFLTSPDVSKNNITLLLDTQYYYFTPDNIESIFNHFGYSFETIDVADIFSRHVFGIGRKYPSVKFLGRNERFKCTQNDILNSLNYMTRFKRSLLRISNWWDRGEVNAKRLGILGTKHNAALALSILGDRVSFIADETEAMVGGYFHDLKIIHSRDCGLDDILVLPYGKSAKSVKSRFKNLYRCRTVRV